MSKHWFYFISASIAVLLPITIWWQVGLANTRQHFTDYEAGFEESIENFSSQPIDYNPYANWQRPAGPLKVALQVGHWQNSEVPEELEGLKKNAGGAQGGGKYEWEVMLNIALLAADILRTHGIEVDVLPTTVPPDYYADAFIALHADGSTDPSVSGFKIASPRRDYSGQSKILEEIMYEKYEEATGLARDPNITSRMRGYYAFNWRRYDHAIHPMTPAVILETGFLTSPADRRILINNTEPVVQGIVAAVLRFLGLS